MSLVLLNLAEARKAEMRRQARRSTQPTQLALSPQLFNLGDGEDARFRRITSPHTRRDLNPLMHERMQQVCFFLSVTTPFGKRFVELMTSYAVGAEGLKLTAKTPAVQEVLDRFAHDDVNQFDATTRDWSDELVRFGELCVPVAVNPVDGFVRLGYIDPQDIECIEYGLLATGDGETEVSVPVAVRLRRRMHEPEGRRMRIIRQDEDPNSATFGQRVGDCFYLPINKAKSASRGISDIFNLADWIDVLDQIVFDGADRARFMNAWLWHVVVKGADEKTVAAFRDKLKTSPPKQGGYQVTNEQVEFKAASPDFKALEYGEIIGNLKAYGLGGMGFPMHWFADPMDANRATAAEMGEPTLKKLEDRQRTIVRFVLNVASFVIEQAVAHGVLPQTVDREIQVQTPKLSKKDLGKGATTLQSLGNSLALAEERGWLTQETAARIYHGALQEVDAEVDSAEEFRKAQAEQHQRETDEVDELAPQANLAEALDRLAAAGGVQ